MLPAVRARRWPRRLVIGLTIFVGVCVLFAGGGYLYLKWRLGQINRLKLSGLSADASGKPMNVLLVGSDSRSRLTGDLADQAGKNLVTGQRSDTIMILHIDPHQRKAAIISVPRDLYLPIAGTNRSDRVNSAYGSGGAERLIETVQQGLGIQINHYVEVDFVGFRDIVNTVGGISIYVPAPARDAMSGLNIANPGCVRFNGDMALAWVRSRHYEYIESGRWRSDPTSDFGRIQRQQDFIRRMLKKAVSTGLTNPLRLNRLIGIGVNDVTIDSAMSTSDMMTLGRRFRSLDANTVDMLTLPTTGANVGGAAVLRLKRADAQPMIDLINGKAPPPGPATATVRPTDIRVRVLNGSGGEGTAAKTADALAGVGFNIADKGDADSYNYRHTVIRYATGQRAKAQLLQRYLSGGATLEEDRSLRTVDVAVVVAPDYTGVRPSPAPAAPGSGPSTAPTTLAPASPVPVPKGAPAHASC